MYSLEIDLPGSMAPKKCQIKIKLRISLTNTSHIASNFEISGDIWKMFKGIRMNNCQTLKASWNISICY